MRTFFLVGLALFSTGCAASLIEGRWNNKEARGTVQYSKHKVPEFEADSRKEALAAAEEFCKQRGGVVIDNEWDSFNSKTIARYGEVKEVDFHCGQPVSAAAPAATSN